MPLKKAHLPSANLKVSLRSDAIRLSYAQVSDESTFRDTLDSPRPTHRPFETPQGWWLR